MRFALHPAGLVRPRVCIVNIPITARQSIGIHLFKIRFSLFDWIELDGVLNIPAG